MTFMRDAVEEVGKEVAMNSKLKAQHPLSEEKEKKSEMMKIFQLNYGHKDS